MKLLTNPLVLRMTFLLFVAGLSCAMGILMVRRLRRSLMEDDFFVEDPPAPEQFPLHTYHAVIQQLKQQKHELVSARQVEQRRAKTSENISAVVLSNLSSGVMFLAENGLVRQANNAAKNILGFASPVGMTVQELFRNATQVPASGARQNLAAEIQAGLRNKTPRSMQAHYATPSGDQRVLEITITPVAAPSGDILGAACLITDKTEMALIQRQQQLRGELSAEMALALRNSLATISGYAQQLAAGRDPERVQRLAADIVSEATQLDHTIGGFLAGAGAARHAAGA